MTLARFLRLLVYISVLGLFFSEQAFADTETLDVFDSVQEKICRIYQQARIVFFGLGGLAGLGVGVMSMFGMFQWSRFFSITAGLLILNMADLVIFYLVGDFNLNSCHLNSTDDDLFIYLESMTHSIYFKTKAILYSLAGVAAIGLGVGAMFGRFSWKWFFSLITGVGIISMIGLYISYLTNDTSW